jgi:uncharacterized repeat protein (TIGR01451 family)
MSNVRRVFLLALLGGLISGAAQAQLTLTKSFLSAASPGGTVALEFNLEVADGDTGDAVGLTFTDDLDATLSGLVATGLPANDVCGTGSQLVGTSLLTLTNGTLPPGGNCTFSVVLQVPGGATPGDYPNTTSAVTATIDGNPVVGNTASDVLTVSPLAFTKAFSGLPALPDGQALLTFTLENRSASETATGLGFTDDLSAMLPGATPASLPPNPNCGGTLTNTPPLTFAGGTLAPGETCSFAILLDLPPDAEDGTYVNTTSALSGSLGNRQIAVPAASADLTIVAERLALTKQFLSSPVLPGATVGLAFTLTNLDGANAASSITFTDDLGAALTGLVATGLPANDVCGAGSVLSGTNLLTLTGASLAAGASCNFQITLQVPGGGAPGVYTNTTSAVAGTMTGGTVLGTGTVFAPPASDALAIGTANFTKSFLSSAQAGGTVVLTFTLTNLDPNNEASALAFLDDLDATLSGLVATGLPANDVCGPGSSLSGTSLLALSNGSLAAAGQPGDSCIFQVTLSVPPAAAAGSYPNTTSELSAAGQPIAPPATADLVILPPTPPTFTKAFAPTNILVGAVATLTFTVDNTASLIAATAISYTDNLPAGMTVANPPNASTTCGGIVSAVAGGTSVGFSGGNVGASSGCTVAVDVTVDAPGAYVNLTDPMSSSSGDSGTATATLQGVPSTLEIPTLDGFGLALLVLAVSGLALARLRRSSRLAG